MNQTLPAIFENGVLRPLGELTLAENQHVTVTVTELEAGPWVDTSFLAYLESQADDAVDIDQVRSALTKIPGSLTADFHAERDERN